ncbi:MAG: 2-C-methyl-D-erythritol 4-phosphate cytidylyltransferase [Candidatus Omnitrophica bacterium]|nr:2-C-methyl-D-erythritol 4-phosphate cytidylyltransferase [Candidatus Omnitrophota bacterium]
MRVTAILLAAGKGKRFKSGVAKPLVKLGKSQIIDYSLKVLERHPKVTEIILVVNSGNIKPIATLVKKSGCKKVRELVLGGARRQDSVFNALNKVSPQSQLVLIHDSARPFVKLLEISVLITRAAKTGAAILGVPVKATIKQVTRSQGHKVTGNFTVERTLDRDCLWEIQTPQVFRKNLLFKAYRKFKDVDVTDDAAMVEKLKKRVDLIKGSYDNIKITTPEDLIIAEAIIKARACLPAGREN